MDGGPIKPRRASTMSGEDVQKGGQKDYYANERNYIHWVHMSLTLGSVSVLIARLAHGEDISSQHRTITLLVSCILAIIGIAFAIYSVRTFFWRRVSMKDSTIGHHANVDEPWGPLILSVMFGMGLFAILIVGWTAPSADVPPKDSPTEGPGNYIPAVGVFRTS